LELKKNNSKLYFHVCFISYIISLILTVTVLHYFKSGQPALLYIVPCMMFSVIGLSIIRGEFYDLIYFNNEEKVKK